MRSGEKGGPALVIDGKPWAPIFFAANNQFDRDDVLLDELRLAADSGIRLFSFNVGLDWHSTSEEAAETVAKFCTANPEGYFYVRTWVGPPISWAQDYPDECITKADGTRLDWASPSSAVWRAAATEQVTRRVHEIIEGPFGHRFIGVCVTYLQTGEWFYPDTDDFMDYSPANLSAFRGWLKKRYGREKRLRQAWSDPGITFDTATFPEPDSRDPQGEGVFRHPENHRPAIDMEAFQSELMADTIIHFAKAVKSATNHRSLVGAFYGYTMELNNNGPRVLAHSGHLAFQKILKSKSIDLIHAPYSYFERGLGEPGHFHLPVDSVALYGKLAILEEDTYTHLAQAPPASVAAPRWKTRTRNLEDTLNVLRRNMGNFLSHRCGFWLFDLLSDGRWSHEAVWNEVLALRRVAAELRNKPPFRPEVAVLVDEASVGLLHDTTHPLLLESLSRWRAEIARTGTPVGYYLLSDASRLPDSVKVLIIPNAYEMNESILRAIRKRLDHGATVIWNYAPFSFGPGGFDPGGIAAATGIAVEPRTGPGPTAASSELTDEIIDLEGASWEPWFVVAEEQDIDVVARYTPSGDICAAARPAGRGVSVYTAVPGLPERLLREIFRRAGVHLYRNTSGMTGVAGPYLIVHTEAGHQDESLDEILDDTLGPKPHTLSWPRTTYEVRCVHPPRAWPMRVEEDGTWLDLLPGGVTALYQITESE